MTPPRPCVRTTLARNNQSPDDGNPNEDRRRHPDFDGLFEWLAGQNPRPSTGGDCIRALLERTGAKGSRVAEVILGNVIGAGIGQNPARQAAILAGLPDFVGATTVNKVCGSGLKAVMLADQSIRLGDASLVIAGGMESMSRDALSPDEGTRRLSSGAW